MKVRLAHRESAKEEEEIKTREKITYKRMPLNHKVTIILY